MNLSHPSLAVGPSLDLLALDVLAGTTAPVTLSALQRRARSGSLGGFHAALSRLASSGLVLKVPGGYLLNRDHVAADAVEILGALRGRLIQRITHAVRDWRPSPTHVAIFGSFARHEGDADSDIDLLIIRERHDPSTDDQAAELSDQVFRWCGNALHVVDIDGADLSRLVSAGEPILSSWRDDAIVLLGDGRLFD